MHFTRNLINEIGWFPLEIDFSFSFKIINLSVLFSKGDIIWRIITFKKFILAILLLVVKDAFFNSKIMALTRDRFFS